MNLNLNHLLLRLTRISICSFAVAVVCHAQGVGVTDDDGNAVVHKKMTGFAKKVKVYATESPAKGETKAKLISKPVFRWTNPERKTDVGNIFLWTVNGRPHATLGIWPENGQYGYEMQSLSKRPFLVEFSNGETWKQNAGGVEFTPLERKARRADQRRAACLKCVTS